MRKFLLRRCQQREFLNVVCKSRLIIVEQKIKEEFPFRIGTVCTLSAAYLDMSMFAERTFAEVNDFLLKLREEGSIRKFLIDRQSVGVETGVTSYENLDLFLQLNYDAARDVCGIFAASEKLREVIEEVLPHAVSRRCDWFKNIRWSCRRANWFVIIFRRKSMSVIAGLVIGFDTVHTW